MPSATGPAVIADVYPLGDEHKKIVGVVFELGGADNHHGLLIGKGSAERMHWPIRAQWEEDIWWYDEVPLMDRSAPRAP